MVQWTLLTSLFTASFCQNVAEEGSILQTRMGCSTQNEVLYAQSDYDQAYGNCTSFYSGNITLSTNYTGSFAMNKVVYFYDNIITASPYVTIISMEVMVTLGGLFITADGPSLELNLPVLNRLDASTLSISAQTPFELGLPMLTTLGEFTLQGNFKNLSLPLLQTCFDITLDGSEGNQTTSLAALDLPSLTTVGGTFSLLGNFSSISLPVLNSTASLTLGVSSPKDISVPALARVEIVLDFHGAVETVSFPALVSVLVLNITNKNTAKTPLHIEVPKLVDVQDIVLSESINVDFPSLAEIHGNLIVESSLALNCTQYKDLWDEFHKGGSYTHYSCEGPHSSMPLRTKLGIGFGAGIAGLIVVCAVGWWIRSKRLWDKNPKLWLLKRSGPRLDAIALRSPKAAPGTL